MASGGPSESVIPPRRASVLAQDALMRRTGGGLFLLGGVVNLAVLTGQAAWSSAAALSLAGVSTAVGVWLLVRRRRLSNGALHLLLVFATLLIAAESLVARDPFAAVLLATLAVFVSVAAFFFGRPQLIAHLSLVTVCAVTATAVHPGVPWWAGLAIAGCAAALTVIAKSLLDTAVAAEFDAVTGLPDRRGFDRHVAAWLGRERSRDAALVLLAVDEPTGGSNRTDPDTALLAVLDAWGPVVDAGAKLGRRDDDQIAILCPTTSVEDTLALVERLRAATPVACAAGVGFHREGDSAPLLIARAEAALLRAKLAGDGRTAVEPDGLDSTAARLQRALNDGELTVEYQPIVELTDGRRLVGIEALVRWRTAQPALAPADVVNVAERNGLVGALDDYVLHTACQDALTLQRSRGTAELMLNVNLSPVNLVDPDLLGRVDGVLDETGWPAVQLTMEITEGTLDLGCGTALRTLGELRHRGILIAVDVFGAGYSSLSRLQALPVDRLKLDKSIIDTVGPECAEPPRLLRAVAAMAGALGLPVTAEGVENRRQAEVLTELGFDQAQGYLFGPACSMAHLTFLTSGRD